MTSRAALLPAVGDPFLLHLWMALYNRDWKDEVDRVYVSIDRLGPENDYTQSVYNFVMNFLEQNEKVTAFRNYSGGVVANYYNLLTHCKEDLMVWIQEDGFIFEKGIVNRQFEKIEHGIVDIVGTPIMAYSPHFNKQLGPLFGEESLFLMNFGYDVWANFAFMRTNDLRSMVKTVSDLDIQLWKKGIIIDVLGIAPEEDVSLDMSIGAMLKLRAQGKKIAIVPQLLAYVKHLDYLDSQIGPSGLWERIEGWTHVTCLSQATVACLNKDCSTLLNIPSGAWGQIFERVNWWLLCWELFHDECNEIKEFSDYYKLVIDTAIESCHIDRGVLRSNIDGLKKMMKL